MAKEVAKTAAEIEVLPAASGGVNDVAKTWFITDLDRIGNTFEGTRQDADKRAVELAHTFPGNTIMVLETVGAYRRPYDRGYVLKLDLIAQSEDDR